MRFTARSLLLGLVAASCTTTPEPPAARPYAAAMPAEGARVAATGVRREAVFVPDAVPPRRPAATASAGEVAPEVRAAGEVITAGLVSRHVEFLASDAMRGRDTPSPELERAAEYLAAEFARLGLEGAGDDGGFIHRWTYRNTRMDFARVAFEGRAADGRSTMPVFARDYFMLPALSDSAVGPLVWAGSAPDVRPLAPGSAAGRILAVHVPGAEPDMQWQQAIGGALQAAFAGGPAGIVFVLDRTFQAGLVGQLASALGGQQALPLHVAGLDYDAARELFRLGNADLDSLMHGDAPADVDGVTVLLRPAQITSTETPPNVAAVLRGSDPVLRDTYVVLTAHFDHVGVGPADAQGDSIFNGADDNASGTSAILAAAEAFAALEQRPARSILFLGVSGEEKGLLGSAYWTENPTVPIESLVANINLDMVGRNHPDSVIGIGLDYSSLGPLALDIAQANPHLGLVIVPDPMPQEQLFFRSDHFNFARRGIPALFLTTGLHEDYHRPSDTPDRIDADKLARVARLAFYVAHRIAATPEPPEWSEKGRQEVLSTQRGGGGP
jgi:hypothetical protein